VTDINLARERVSYVMPKFPQPNEWVHLTLAWDETRGIRFYVNGQLAARQDARTVLYAGLDQFGPHSRTIGPMQVQSDYNFTRGGDIDEIRIYDRMLSDENVASLAKGNVPRQIPALGRDLNQKEWRDEWWLRPAGIEVVARPEHTGSVRKVDDVYDLKRWWWADEIGDHWPASITTRVSRRNDYFQLPDGTAILSNPYLHHAG
jgi:hypothetical protein